MTAATVERKRAYRYVVIDHGDAGTEAEDGPPRAENRDAVQ